MSNNKHHILYLAGVEAFPEKSKSIVQKQINILWSEIKDSSKNYENELRKLQEKAEKSKTSVLSYWKSIPKCQPDKVEIPSAAENLPIMVSTTAIKNESIEPAVEAASANSVCNGTPAQLKIKDQKAAVNKKITHLCLVEKTVGLAPPLRKEMTRLLKEKVLLDTKLKRAQQNQKAQQKNRDLNRKAMMDLAETHPDAAKHLRYFGVQGKPPLESQPEMTGLHSTILDIVIPNSSADERRRTEVYNICQSLDFLKEKLAERGYNLTRTALYYR